VLKFIPFADLAILDPLATTLNITLYHGYMVYDTLYGQTGQQSGFKCTPQMVEGHVVENDGKTWRLTLRDRLLFHNGEKVLATDCVASIKRWGVRDLFGQALMSRTDEVSAPDDKTIVLRLKQPFPLLPDALGHAFSNMCAIMPKHIAETDPFKQITEVIGSGPFRFKADEWVHGAFVAYERFDQYKPREVGDVSFHCGSEDRAFRQGRVARTAGCRHQGRGDTGRRGGLVGKSDTRSAAAAAQAQDCDAAA
jgi:peptide/nickel transport system substrate-binding protein